MAMHRMRRDHVVIHYIKELNEFWMKSPNGVFKDMNVTEDFSKSDAGKAMLRGDCPNPLIIGVTDQ